MRSEEARQSIRKEIGAVKRVLIVRLSAFGDIVHSMHAVAGLDEAGRGAWAGPVAAAAVVLPPEAGVASRLSGVRDSKQMAPAARQRWADAIRESAAAWGVG